MKTRLTQLIRGRQEQLTRYAVLLAFIFVWTIVAIQLFSLWYQNRYEVGASVASGLA